MDSKAVFGSAIASILLGIYVYLVWLATAAAGAAPLSPERAAFTSDMASTLSLIGGLIGALVIAELAITEPGKPPAARALAGDPTPRAANLLKIVTTIYIAVWLLTGLGALLVGLHHPEAVPALTNLGKSWFGLAIAAGYAYFGLRPG